MGVAPRMQLAFPLRKPQFAQLCKNPPTGSAAQVAADARQPEEAARWRLPAIREKHLDVWQTWDRARLAAEVRVLAGGLAFPIRSTTAKSQATASILHFCSLTLGKRGLNTGFTAG